tara:strand:+ start:162 stop:344 length:183 start_codon:yes stop_codon:yes gene_type:complete
MKMKFKPRHELVAELNRTKEELARYKKALSEFTPKELLRLQFEAIERIVNNGEFIKEDIK